MNPIARRVVTALSTATLAVCAFLFLPLWCVAPIVAALAALVQFEFYRMVSSRYETAPRVGCALGVAWIALVALLPAAHPLAGWACGVPGIAVTLFVLASYVLLNARFARPLETLAVTFCGFLYVPFLLASFVRLVQMDAAGVCGLPASRVGLYTLLFALAATKLSDMGGFAFGMAWGRHRMCPAISPKKSWEGFVGSVIGASLIVALFVKIAAVGRWGDVLPVWRAITWAWVLPLGFAFAAVGTLGDLVESRFKREVNVKDSATFMPAGLGGFLDMFDSILFAPALFSYAAALC